MNKHEKTVLNDLKDEFKTIENIPSEIGEYNSRPVFIKDREMKNGFMVADREVNGIKYLAKQYSPSFRQKDANGYFYVVYYKIISQPAKQPIQ